VSFGISPRPREPTRLPGDCQAFPRTLSSLARLYSFSAGDSVYHQEEPADYWYCILGGAARKSAIMTDGRRHIVAFLLAGEFFGFCSSSTHQFSVEVISPHAVIARYSRSQAEMLAYADAEVGRCVREAAFQSIGRLQARMVLLGRNAASEKVAAFLLEMLDRSSDATGMIDLPMSRYDIADYLSVAVETVSRTLTTMRARRLIKFSGTRQLKIVDRIALETLAGTAHRQGCGDS
jgi:CRP-like cAMP-binding protein